MEISNSINQPVNFYNKNTGNNINVAMESENRLNTPNIFAPEFVLKEVSIKTTRPLKKKRKGKRLNTVDSDFLPDETEETASSNNSDNFFIEQEKFSIKKNLKKAFEYFITSVPLINYFFLTRKKSKIKATIKTLKDINQNVDDLLNTAVPYGEEKDIYNDIAKNLTDAASIMGKANKEL